MLYVLTRMVATGLSTLEVCQIKEKEDEWHAVDDDVRVDSAFVAGA